MSGLSGQSRGFEIKPAAGQDGGLVSVNPGENLALRFIVTNTSARKLALKADYTTPQDWQVLTVDTVYTIESGRFELGFLTLFIPLSAKAGTFTVTYRVYDVADLSSLKTLSFDVTVESQAAIRVRQTESPQYAIGGDKYTAAFMVKNSGNVDLRVGVEVESGNSWSWKLVTPDGSDELFIRVGESSECFIEVQTSNTINKVLTHQLEIRFAAYGHRDIDKTVYSFTQVVPRISGDTDIYHELPIVLTEEITWQDDTAGLLYNLLKVEAKGTIDEKGFHNVDLLLQKKTDFKFDPATDVVLDSDVHDDILVNRLDVYRLGYVNDYIDVLLGDAGYGLSPVLEIYRYGRGLRLAGMLDSFRIGGFAHQPLYGTQHSGYYGGFLRFTLRDDAYIDNARYKAQSSVYYNEAGGMRFGLHQIFNPLKILRFEGDAGVALDGPQGPLWAGLFKSSGNFEHIVYNLTAKYSMPGFPGPIRDTLAVFGNLQYRFLENRARASLGYLYEDRNLERDTSLASAGFEQKFEAAGAYLFLPSKLDLVLSYKYRDRYDQLPVPGFDEDIHNVVIRTKMPIEDTKLRFTTDYTFTLDNLSGGLSFFHKHQLGANQPLSNNVQMDVQLFAEIMNDTEHEDYGQVGWQVSTGITFDSMLASVDFKNNYFVRGGDLDWITFAILANAVYAFSENDKLTGNMSINIKNVYGEFNRVFALQLFYVHTFDVPLSRKTTVGILRGTIIDNDTGEPLENVIVRTSGKVSVTTVKDNLCFLHLCPMSMKLISNVIPSARDGSRWPSCL